MAAELLSWGIEQGYIDARGHPQKTAPATIEKLARALASGRANDIHQDYVVALRRHEPPRIRLPDGAVPVCWQLFGNGKVIASAQVVDGTMALPDDLEIGSYELSVDAVDGVKRHILVLIAPAMAYQPPLFRDGGRAWLVMVQLYAVRSTRNWGHGDFSDLAQLLTDCQLGSAPRELVSIRYIPSLPAKLAAIHPAAGRFSIHSTSTSKQSPSSPGRMPAA